MSDFRITPQELPNDTVSISVTGNIDTMTSPQLEEAILKFYNRGIYKFIVDLSKVEHMSSAGAGVLTHVLELVRTGDYKGDLVLVQPKAGVKEMLNMLGLTRFLTIAPDQATALKSLGQWKKQV